MGPYGPGVAPSAGGSSTPYVNPLIFGDGSDGNAVITGTFLVNRPMSWANLTISGAGQIRTNGWPLRVAGTLDITAAGHSAVYGFVAGSNVANPANGATGGASPNLSVTGTSPLPVSTPSGTTGTTGAGGSGVSTANPVIATHAIAINAGAAGGSGTSAGGAAAAAMSVGVAPSNQAVYYGFDTSFGNYIGLGSVYRTTYMPSGPGGAAGGGDGTTPGGGGGAGGYPPDDGTRFANTIVRGAGTASGAFWFPGQTGGSGGTAPTGNCGGGGGGGGAPGGRFWLIYNTLSGSTVNSLIDVRGGNGGPGGNGVGTGAGGQGGPGGPTGLCMVHQLGVSATLYAPGSSGAAAVAAPGSTGGAGGAGAPLLVNL